jgi:hypothetical protein
MVQVKLTDSDATHIMEIVRELRLQGLLQGRDFDFAFNQSKWDDMIGEIPRTTVFTFYTEKWSSWFILKYKV